MRGLDGNNDIEAGIALKNREFIKFYILNLLFGNLILFPLLTNSVFLSTIDISFKIHFHLYFSIFSFIALFILEKTYDKVQNKFLIFCFIVFSLLFPIFLSSFIPMFFALLDSRSIGKTFLFPFQTGISGILSGSFYWIPFGIYVYFRLYQNQKTAYRFTKRMVLVLISIVILLVGSFVIGINSDFNSPFRKVLEKSRLETFPFITTLDKMDLKVSTPKNLLLFDRFRFGSVSPDLLYFYGNPDLKRKLEISFYDVEFDKKNKTPLTIVYGGKRKKYELDGIIHDYSGVIISNLLYLVWFQEEWNDGNQRITSFYLKIIDLNSLEENYSGRIYQEVGTATNPAITYLPKENLLLLVYNMISPSLKGLQYFKIGFNSLSEPILSDQTKSIFYKNYDLDFDKLKFWYSGDGNYLFSLVRSENRIFGYTGGKNVIGIVKFEDFGNYDSIRIFDSGEFNIHNVFVDDDLNFTLTEIDTGKILKINFDKMYKIDFEP
ncbi:hypothetical protein LEP1GSC193_0054 [Leptospira alstonii serovar Pingchang str. 80-412]|uniref:Uncharacterized protein n=3 Tax=Leptospira alstonii TaxID=28452 RepID=M6CTK5_9LEPT|nr:hypothetical protein LEP1GSC194_1006 [Leptospira alstonii serovar Sichuan str. 79601]EQA79104.1 hypothetical protein LEP1GSC193_0054 [Leptospira alstonii serovar Pingchang str. 80-412]